MQKYKYVLIVSQNDGCIRLEFNEQIDAESIGHTIIECGDVKTAYTIIKEVADE